MTAEPLLVPLPSDCDDRRRQLIDMGVPAVWQIDATTARELQRAGALATREAWQPPVDSLPVSVDDIEGGTGAAGRLPAMRRYLPDVPAAGPATTLLWLHGGGWVLGDLDTTDAAARTICAAAGWEVVTADYRCAPWHPFPAAADDCLAAAEWVLARRERVVVGGDSAGGNLAAVVAQQLGADSRLVGQVLVYPCADPTLASASAAEFTEGPFLARRDMEWFYDQYLPPHVDRTDPRVDLVTGFDRRGVVPVPAVVVTVGHDPLRDEGIAYADLLRASGHEVRWLHAPELFHGAYSLAGVLPSSGARVAELWDVATRFLAVSDSV